MYKVESGIPLPKKKIAGNFPFDNMKVGDSFLLNGKAPQTVGYLAAVFARQQEPKWKFTIRKTEQGYRCWRIS